MLHDGQIRSSEKFLSEHFLLFAAAVRTCEYFGIACCNSSLVIEETVIRLTIATRIRVVIHISFVYEGNKNEKNSFSRNAVFDGDQQCRR